MGLRMVFFHDYNDCNHGGMNAIIENVHHKNDNNYNIEMTIVTYNECINFNIIRQSRTIVHNHNDNKDDDNNNKKKRGPQRQRQ